MATKKTMRAVILEEFNKPPVIKEVEIPVPQKGQVLIKIESAPLNPADLIFMAGQYSSSKTLPCVPGVEGSGVVVANGGGFMGWYLLGKRVAVVSETKWGTYAEYCIADVNGVLPLPDNITFNQGASTFINPLTAIGFLQITKEKKAKAIVHSAAASSLGRMMVRYFQDNGVKIINIVRRQEQVDILKKEGAQFIFDSTKPDFEEKLKAACTNLNATLFFDPVAGELTGKVLKCMPKSSTAIVYGGLSLSACVIDPTGLIFSKQNVTGFWLNEWLESKNIFSLISALNKVKKLLQSQLKTEISMIANLQDINSAIEYYTQNMSKGKVMFKPQGNINSV